MGGRAERIDRLARLFGKPGDKEWFDALLERERERLAERNLAVEEIKRLRKRERELREALGCAEYALMTGSADSSWEALELIRALHTTPSKGEK